jgi:hypothetical protein
MMPELGLIEGRFGRIWSEEERGYVVQHARGGGLASTTMAPRPTARCAAPGASATTPNRPRCWSPLRPRARGGHAVRHRADADRLHAPDDEARADLARRVADLDAIGIDDLAICSTTCAATCRTLPRGRRRW